MKKRTKTILLIILVVVILIVAAIALFINKSNQDLEQLSAAKIENVDLSAISDGEYLGEYSAFPISVEVKVAVINHQMAKITILEHRNGQGKSAESIVNTVVQSQSLNVDSVSGATYSSKVILKAIEDALVNADN